MPFRCLQCLRGYDSHTVCPVCHRVCAHQSPQLFRLWQEQLYDYIPGARPPWLIRLWRWLCRKLSAPYKNTSALPPLPINSPFLLDHLPNTDAPAPRSPGRG